MDATVIWNITLIIVCGELIGEIKNLAFGCAILIFLNYSSARIFYWIQPRNVKNVPLSSEFLNEKGRKFTICHLAQLNTLRNSIWRCDWQFRRYVLIRLKSCVNRCMFESCEKKRDVYIGFCLIIFFFSLLSLRFKYFRLSEKLNPEPFTIDAKNK